MGADCVYERAHFSQAHGEIVPRFRLLNEDITLQLYRTEKDCNTSNGYPEHSTLG